MGNQQGGGTNRQGPPIIIRNSRGYSRVSNQYKKLLDSFSEESLKKLSQDEKLAPLEVCETGQAECPICFLNYNSLNSTNCCNQHICSNCYGDICRNHLNQEMNENKNSDPTLPPCPFCSHPSYTVSFSLASINNSTTSSSSSTSSSSNTTSSTVSSTPTTTPSKIIPATLSERTELENKIRKQQEKFEKEETEFFNEQQERRQRLLKEQAAAREASSSRSRSSRANQRVNEDNFEALMNDRLLNFILRQSALISEENSRGEGHRRGGEGNENIIEDDEEDIEEDDEEDEYLEEEDQNLQDLSRRQQRNSSSMPNNNQRSNQLDLMNVFQAFLDPQHLEQMMIEEAIRQSLLESQQETAHPEPEPQSVPEPESQPEINSTSEMNIEESSEVVVEEPKNSPVSSADVLSTDDNISVSSRDFSSESNSSNDVDISDLLEN